MVGGLGGWWLVAGGCSLRCTYELLLMCDFRALLLMCITGRCVTFWNCQATGSLQALNYMQVTYRCDSGVQGVMADRCNHMMVQSMVGT